MESKADLDWKYEETLIPGEHSLYILFKKGQLAGAEPNPYLLLKSMHLEGTEFGGGSFCALCDQGFWKDGEDCVPCPAGTESSDDRTQCVHCPEGTFRDTFGSAGYTERCLECPDFFTSSDDRSHCIPFDTLNIDFELRQHLFVIKPDSEQSLCHKP